MPTIRYRTRIRSTSEISDDVVELFETGAAPTFRALRLRGHEGELRAAWEAQRAAILAEWLARVPGTRPWAWWRLDAPEPRQRLGGTGDPFGDEVSFGVSVYWFTPRLRDALTETDEHGRPVKARPSYRRRGKVLTIERDMEPVPFDAHDPPVYESEAAFLRRHGLLSARETKVLRDEAFLPVALSVTKYGSIDPT